MTMHSMLRDMLRDLLEPVYQGRPGLKGRLRAAQAQLNRMRSAAGEQFPQLADKPPLDLLRWISRAMKSRSCAR